MSSFALTLYVLIWPVIAAAVLITLCVSLYRDMRKAKRDGTDLV
ncbi:putative transporter small subunit [Pseudomonas capeferrum]|nr:putative transporter small subunit [Pseudomonas capeferrum]